MKIGYARVSTEDQKLDLQLSALKRAGCHKIFTDQGVAGNRFQRPGLQRALKELKPGQTLIVWRLDRLGRSLVKLLQFVDALGKRNVEFLSLTENIDTTSSGGRLVFHMMGALAEFERTLISERTRAGMEAARKQGRHVGRPPSLTPEQVQEAISLRTSGEKMAVIAERMHVKERTLRRLMESRRLNHTAGRVR